MITDQPEAEWVSVGVAARILGVSVKTLRRWDEQGKFPSGRTTGGHRRYKRSDVEKLLWQQHWEADEALVKPQLIDSVGSRLIDHWVGKSERLELITTPQRRRGWWPLLTVFPLTLVLVMAAQVITPSGPSYPHLLDYWKYRQYELAERVLGGIGLDQEAADTGSDTSVLGTTVREETRGVALIQAGETRQFVRLVTIEANDRVELESVGEKLPLFIGLIEPGDGFWVQTPMELSKSVAFEWRVVPQD